MTGSTRKSFRAVLEAAGQSPRWVLARVPIDLKKAWPAWQSRRVFGEINGFAFRTALLPSAGSTRHVLVVNKKMQAGAKAGPGSTVRIWIEPDREEQVVALPAEFALSLKVDRRLRRWFDALSPSMRKGIVNFVDQAKSAETRAMRAERMTESLMLAMEGEQMPPPILRAAFQRQPLVQRGWDAMTPTQRRNHLLGIFYVQTIDGRERRVAKAVDDCLRVARQKTKDRSA